MIEIRLQSIFITKMSYDPIKHRQYMKALGLDGEADNILVVS